MTQIVCKDTHKRRDNKIKLHLFTFIQLINRYDLNLLNENLLFGMVNPFMYIHYILVMTPFSELSKNWMMF